MRRNLLQGTGCRSGRCLEAREDRFDFCDARLEGKELAPNAFKLLRKDFALAAPRRRSLRVDSTLLPRPQGVPELATMVFYAFSMSSMRSATRCSERCTATTSPHQQMVHLLHRRCDPRATRSLRLRVSGQRLHLAPKDLVDFVPKFHCRLLFDLRQTLERGAICIERARVPDPLGDAEFGRARRERGRRCSEQRPCRL
jgi:hypothetical protein